MKKLPIGLQDFRGIREDGYFYLDKTQEIHQLLTTGKYYFLSRPRRFGKSLLVSTLKEIYQGSESLFINLWIQNHWDWSQSYPVIHLSFSELSYFNDNLENALLEELADIAQRQQLTVNGTSVSQRFRQLIRALAPRGKVILLIDEYDKPLIDYLEHPDQLRKNREILKQFYSILKDSDPYLKFVLITGVSKFSQVSIFSDLNNLRDISLNYKFAKLLGYTDIELRENFAEEITAISQEQQISEAALLEKIKYWYDGYSWDGNHFMYNPFSVLSFFDNRRFGNFWFATGTPTFLTQLARQQAFYKFRLEEVRQTLFDVFSLETLPIVPILFQTGYLTIKKVDFINGTFTLDYPNQEVKDAMLQFLLAEYRHASVESSHSSALQLKEAFVNADGVAIIKGINTLFKNIPYQIFTENKEAYYHSVIYLILKYLGSQIESEVSTADGRIDAVVRTANYIYVIEFKLDKSAKAGMEQIKKKNYPAKYQDLLDQEIIALAINFSSKDKQVKNWLMEKL